MALIARLRSQWLTIAAIALLIAAGVSPRGAALGAVLLLAVGLFLSHPRERRQNALVALAALGIALAVVALTELL